MELPMDRPLVGRLILIVEDEPLIVMDVAQGLKAAGASVSVARMLSDALAIVEAPGLSAAVLDHRLNDGDSSQICNRLDARNIPFVVYSGYAKLDGPCSEGKQVSKPVRPEKLVAAVIDALGRQSARHPAS
jgi:DNA-binding response OmpR family regulator